MKVSGVSTNKIINMYREQKKITKNKKLDNKSDLVEISSVGRSLSSFSADGKFVSSSEKIEKIRNEVSSGTYKRNSKLVAQKIIDNFKRRGI